MDIRSAVRTFHRVFGLGEAPTPGFPDNQVRITRRNLLREEFQEYLDAEEADDLVEVADALGDMVYIINGTALKYGIDLDRVLMEIHRSNMTKLDENGKPIMRADGKVLKSDQYEAPDIHHAVYSDVSEEQRLREMAERMCVTAAEHGLTLTLIRNNSKNKIEDVQAMLKAISEIVSGNPHNGYILEVASKFIPRPINHQVPPSEPQQVIELSGDVVNDGKPAHRTSVQTGLLNRNRDS